LAKNKRTKNREKQLRQKKVQKKVTEKKAPFVTMPKDHRQQIVQIDEDRWMRAILARDQDVFRAIVDYLFFFENHHYKMLGTAALKDLGHFIRLTYDAMLTEGFNPRNEDAINLVQLSHIFQQLVAVSGYKTNDGPLRNIMLQKDNLVKALFLQNPRCEFQVDQKKFFDANPQIASIWHGVYMGGLSTPTKTLQQNIYRHLMSMDERYTIANHRQTATYFTCTYHCPEHALRCKSIMNKAIQEAGVPTFNNRPSGGEKKHIAIITNRWHRNHAVYKSAGPLVEQLRDKYRLSLIWTSPGIPDTTVKDYFESFSQCYFQNDGSLIIPPELQDNDFDMVYFPDVGMSDESIWLANSKIAPIQAVGYGHPDSTGANNHIDYFICGDVEKDADDAYSETRVCLPGLAQEPAWPTAAKEDNYIDDGIVRINCVWGPDKYNHTLLSVLEAMNHEVYGRTGKAPTHEFHLFGSPGMNRYGALPAFMNDVMPMLPNAHVHTEWEYYDYMREMQKNDFALNSFPFGCYNVLIESLWAGIPFLTLVGERFYNRAGMWLNDQVGMSENNFQIPRELVNHAVDLILNPELLKAQREHLAGVDLKEKLFTLKGNYFLEAIDYIFANHPFTETKIIGENE
jgi:predicted O-linked N-acetylglucosamine transferase (SPINDLY family)